MDDTLEAATIRGACAVAVMTSNDLTNVETGLAMRARLGDVASSTPLVLRVFDRKLGGIVERDFGFRDAKAQAVAHRGKVAR